MFKKHKVQTTLYIQYNSVSTYGKEDVRFQDALHSSCDNLTCFEVDKEVTKY